MKLRSRYTYGESTGQTDFAPSCTIEDDCLSIREILVRFSSGQPLPPSTLHPQYPDVEPNIDDPIANVDWDEPTSVSAYRSIVDDRINHFQSRKKEIEERIKSVGKVENTEVADNE